MKSALEADLLLLVIPIEEALSQSSLLVIVLQPGVRRHPKLLTALELIGHSQLSSFVQYFKSNHPRLDDNASTQPPAFPTRYLINKQLY